MGRPRARDRTRAGWWKLLGGCMDLARQEPGGRAWVEAQAGEGSSEPTSEPKGEGLSRWLCSRHRFKSTLRGDVEAEKTVLLEELWEPDEPEVGGEEGREDV